MFWDFCELYVKRLQVLCKLIFSLLSISKYIFLILRLQTLITRFGTAVKYNALVFVRTRNNRLNYNHFYNITKKAIHSVHVLVLCRLMNKLSPPSHCKISFQVIYLSYTVIQLDSKFTKANVRSQ